MSRLSYMQQQELVIQTIADELDQLQQIVLNGEEISPENVLLLDSCIAQSIRIRDAINKHADDISLPDWMQKADSQITRSGKESQSRLVKQA